MYMAEEPLKEHRHPVHPERKDLQMSLILKPTIGNMFNVFLSILCV